MKNKDTQTDIQRCFLPFFIPVVKLIWVCTVFSWLLDGWHVIYWFIFSSLPSLPPSIWRLDGTTGRVCVPEEGCVVYNSVHATLHQQSLSGTYRRIQFTLLLDKCKHTACSCKSPEHRVVTPSMLECDFVNVIAQRKCKLDQVYIIWKILHYLSKAPLLWKHFISLVAFKVQIMPAESTVKLLLKTQPNYTDI